MDNIFEMETSAFAQCTCMAQDSGIILTDFACAHPSVSHDWIFRVRCRAGLTAFVQEFRRMIHDDSVTAVEYVSATLEDMSRWQEAYGSDAQRADSFLQ